MEMTPQPEESRGVLKGTVGLIVAVAVVAVLFIWLPAYRYFFLISLAIGCVVAGALYLWHGLHPVKAEDIENKKPLGLE
jgi:hypothetical protein